MFSILPHLCILGCAGFHVTVQNESALRLIVIDPTCATGPDIMQVQLSLLKKE